MEVRSTDGRISNGPLGGEGVPTFCENALSGHGTIDAQGSPSWRLGALIVAARWKE